MGGNQGSWGLPKGKSGVGLGRNRWCGKLSGNGICPNTAMRKSRFGGVRGAQGDGGSVYTAEDDSPILEVTAERGAECRKGKYCFCCTEKMGSYLQGGQRGFVQSSLFHWGGKQRCVMRKPAGKAIRGGCRKEGGGMGVAGGRKDFGRYDNKELHKEDETEKGKATAKQKAPKKKKTRRLRD